MDEKIELLLYGQQYKKFQETFYGDLMVQYHLNVIDIRVLFFMNIRNGIQLKILFKSIF